MPNNLRVKTSKAIDETYRISFKFNNSTYYGFKGDTLASALLVVNTFIYRFSLPLAVVTSSVSAQAMTKSKQKTT